MRGVIVVKRKMICAVSVVCILTMLLQGVAFAGMDVGSMSSLSSVYQVYTDELLLKMSGYSTVLMEKIKSVFENGVGYSDTQIGGSGADSNGKAFGGSQCWAYANSVMYKLFGVTVSNSGNGSVSGATAKASSLTGKSSVSFDMFQAAGIPQRAATLFRSAITLNTGSDSGDGGHSLVILYYDEDYVYFIDGNYDTVGGVLAWRKTWSEFNDSHAFRRGTSTRFIEYVTYIKDTKFDAMYPADMEEDYPISTVYYERAVYKGDGTSDNRVKKLPYSGSDVETLDSYTTEEFTVVAAVKNKYNNIWYKVEGGGYIYSGDVIYVRSDAKISANGTVSPTGELKKGAAFYNNKGTIDSSDSIVKVVGGIYQGSTCVSGEPIVDTISGQLLRSYSMSDSPIALKMKFGTLPLGDYTYRVDVYYGTHGLWKTVIETRFSVVENVSSGEESTQVTTLMISDVAYPSTQTPGKGTYAKGTIKSDAIITSVTASIYDINGDRINYTSAMPNSTMFDLLTLDSNIKFGQCTTANSHYSYIITAEDAAGRKLGLWMDIATGSSSTTQKISYASRRYVEPELVATAELNNSEYHYYSSTMNWEDAQVFAESLGGHLAVIGSAEEQEVLYDSLPITTGYYYLGGRYVDNEFFWVNGEEVGYTNFQVGEPNHKYGLQQDVIMNSGKEGEWADIFFGDTMLFGFIVEIEPGIGISSLSLMDSYAYQMPGVGSSWDMSSEVLIYPENATDYNFVFTSSDESIVSCSEDGTNVVVRKYGFAYITVTDTVSGLSISVPFGTPEWNLLESVHNYANNASDYYQYIGNYEYQFVTFSEDTYVEEDYDWIIIQLPDGSDYARFTGDELAGKTIFIPAKEFLVNIQSDSSVNGYGFKITDVEGFVEYRLTSVAEFPANISSVEAEAFEGSDFQVVHLENCESIGSRAFANSKELRIVYVEDGIEFAQDAFEGCSNLVFFMNWYSESIEEYADSHGFFVHYIY